jgi:hypothetical protein
MLLYLWDHFIEKEADQPVIAAIELEAAVEAGILKRLG